MLVIIACITVSARLWLFVTPMMLQVPTGRQQGQQMSCTLCLRMNLCIMMHLMCRKKTEVMHLERKENVRGLPEAICVFEQCNYCLAVGLLLLYLLDIINWLDQQAAFHFA